VKKLKELTKKGSFRRKDQFVVKDIDIIVELW
jgi:hypothetical protein